MGKGGGGRWWLLLLLLLLPLLELCLESLQRTNGGYFGELRGYLVAASPFQLEAWVAPDGNLFAPGAWLLFGEEGGGWGSQRKEGTRHTGQWASERGDGVLVEGQC